MKITKSVFALIFSIIFICLTVSGCKKDDKSYEDSDMPVLKIGSDEYTPHFYIDENGSFAGIDVELAEEACRRIGLRAEFHKIQWQDKDAYLERGEVDCLWGCFSMTGREERYIWAGPYMNSRQVVVAAADSDIYTLSDLKGKRVGVQMSSKPDEIFSENDFGIKCVYCFSNMDYVLAALRKDYVDAIAGHESALVEFIKESKEDYRILDDALLQVELGVAFYRDSTSNIPNALKEILIEMQNDGFTENILTKYGLSQLAVKSR